MCGVTAKLAKLLLFTINVIVWICGAAILGVGIALAVDESTWAWFSNISGDMNDDLFAAAVYMMIGVGSVLFLVGFLGCCGTCKGSVCLLQCYIILVSILIAVEITGAILAIVYKDSLDESVRDEMRTGLRQDYIGVNRTESSTSVAWNSMQDSLKCCGAYNHTDYKGSVWSQGTRDDVPITCCKGVVDEGNGFYTISNSDKSTCMIEGGQVNPSNTVQLYTKGCYDALWDWMAEQADIIIGVLVGLGFIQIFGLITACCMKSRLQDVDD